VKEKEQSALYRACCYDGSVVTNVPRTNNHYEHIKKHLPIIKQVNTVTGHIIFNMQNEARTEASDRELAKLAKQLDDLIDGVLEGQ